MWPSFGSSVVCRRLQGQRGGDPVYHRGLECSRADFPGQGCSVSTGSNREGRSNVSPTKWPEPGFRTGPHPSPSWELVMAPRAWGEEVFMFVPSVKGRGPPVYPLFIQNLLGSWEKGAGGGGCRWGAGGGRSLSAARETARVLDSVSKVLCRETERRVCRSVPSKG